MEDDEGAKEYQGKHDILNSKYYKSLDIYNMKSSWSLILLKKFKTYQQTTSYSCAYSSLIMAINYVGNEVIGEKDCSEKAETDTEYGTIPPNYEKTIKENLDMILNQKEHILKKMRRSLFWWRKILWIYKVIF